MPPRPLLASLLIAALIGAATARAGAVDEAQIGAQAYQELAGRGELVAASPWYGVLNEIGRKIAAVADAQYQYPFHFILVREQQPNAFSVPGGNVYVTLPLMTFVRNKEELASVLCHEVSHDIHHDVVQLARKQETTGLIGAALQILLGGNSAVVGNAIGIAAQLQDLHYSRNVEEAADQKGARICAAAGYNPWGMVWLFRQFEKGDTGGSMEMLSDHPTDEHRIAALQSEFSSNPRLFGRYSPNAAKARPMPSYSGLAARYGNARPFGAARRPGY